MPFESIQAGVRLLEQSKSAKAYSDQMRKLQQQEGPDQEI